MLATVEGAAFGELLKSRGQGLQLPQLLLLAHRSAAFATCNVWRPSSSTTMVCTCIIRASSTRLTNRMRDRATADGAWDRVCYACVGHHSSH